MVGIQASKLLPYPAEEIIYDYKVIETAPDGYSRIMLVLTHRNVIEKILKIFKDAGIGIQRIALSSEALSLWYLSRGAYLKENQSTAFINIDSVSCDIQIISSRIVKLTRAITLSEEDRLNRLSEEMHRTFLTYKKEPRPAISRLVLSGPESVVGVEAMAIKKEFGLSTVFVDPIRTWPLAQGAKLPDANSRKAFSFTTALALAFNYNRLELNLLPESIQKARATTFAKETLLITGLLCLCIILGGGGILWKKLVDKTNYLKYINAQIRRSEERVGQLTTMAGNVSIIKDQLDMSGSSIDVVRELYRIVPPNISLTIVDIEELADCTLRGTAEELSDAFRFITILEESVYFQNVKVRYATKRVVKKRMITDFEITCTLVPPPRQRVPEKQEGERDEMNPGEDII